MQATVLGQDISALENEGAGAALADLRKLRVAIVHYWLLRMRGGEKVVESLCRIFPKADIFTLFYSPEDVSGTISDHKVTTSFLQRLPGWKHYYRKLLPIFPFAIEQFDLSKYDLVLSSESGIAKGALTTARTCHICYCHTPMRYAWDHYHFYRDYRSSWMSRGIFALTAHYVRIWDYASSARVNYFLANSKEVQARIRKHYRRSSEVITPPADISAFVAVESPSLDYYLVVSELVSYKRVDLAVAACTELNLPLKVVGRGPELSHLRKIAGPTVQFPGFQNAASLQQLYANAKALLQPGEEDAGIVAIEAQACGRPVIAYGSGGVLDTVIDGETGILYDEQSVAALMQALLEFERIGERFSPERIRTNAERFGVAKFEDRLTRAIYRRWLHHRQHYRAGKSLLAV